MRDESILTTLGLQDFIATSRDDYIRRAAKLAANPAELTRLRASMRQRVARSQLCNGRQFTTGLEKAYSEMVSAVDSTVPFPPRSARRLGI